MSGGKGLGEVYDPLVFKEQFWPYVEFYDKQVEIIKSIQENDETYVVAGNMLGKDFVTGYIALSFFLRPQMYFPKEYVQEIERNATPADRFPHTRRVVTTSVKDDHLRVLWGEIGRYIQTCKYPLEQKKNGPLVVNHREIRLAYERNLELKNVMNYLIGTVSKSDEGLSGHHAAYTLMIGDEASGIQNSAYKAGQGWAKKFLFIGNPNPCPPNQFFRKAVESGTLYDES